MPPDEEVLPLELPELDEVEPEELPLDDAVPEEPPLDEVPPSVPGLGEPDVHAPRAPKTSTIEQARVRLRSTFMPKT